MSEIREEILAAVKAPRANLPVSSRRKVLATIAASRRIYGAARREDRMKIRNRRRVNRHAYHATMSHESLELEPQKQKELRTCEVTGQVKKITRFHQQKVVLQEHAAADKEKLMEALKIQSVYRGYSTRENAKTMKVRKRLEEEFQKEEELRLQEEAEQKREEEKLSKKKVAREREEAAFKIQVHMRSKLARKEVAKRRQLRDDIRNTPLLTHKWVTQLLPSDKPMPRRIVNKLFHRFAGEKKQLTLADLAALLRDLWAREFPEEAELTSGYIQFVYAEIFDATKRIFINAKEFPSLFDMYWTRREGIRRKFFLIHPDGGAKRESILGSRATQKEASWQTLLEDMGADEVAARSAKEAALSSMRAAAATGTEPVEDDMIMIKAELENPVREAAVQTKEFGAPVSTVRAASSLLELVRNGSPRTALRKVHGPPKTVRLGCGLDEDARWHFQGPPRATTDHAPAGWAPAVGGLQRDLNDQHLMSLHMSGPLSSISGDSYAGGREGHIDSSRFLETSTPPPFNPSSALKSRAPRLMDPGKTQLRSPPPRAQESLVPPVVALPDPSRKQRIETEPELPDPLPRVVLSAIDSVAAMANSVAASQTPQQLLANPPQPPSLTPQLPAGVEPVEGFLRTAPLPPCNPVRDPLQLPAKTSCAPPLPSLGFPELPQLSPGGGGQPKRIREQPQSPQKSSRAQGPTVGVFQPSVQGLAAATLHPSALGIEEISQIGLSSEATRDALIPPMPPLSSIREPNEKDARHAIATAAENFVHAEADQLRMIVGKNLHDSFERHCVASAVHTAALESEKEELRQSLIDFEIGMQQKKQRQLIETLETVQRLEKEQNKMGEAALNIEMSAFSKRRDSTALSSNLNVKLITQAAEALEKLATTPDQESLHELPNLLTRKPVETLQESSVIAGMKPKILGREQLHRVFSSFCTTDGLLGLSDFHRLVYSLHVTEQVSRPTVEMSSLVFREVFGVEEIEDSIDLWTFERYFNYFYAHRDELKQTYCSLPANRDRQLIGISRA